MTRRLLGPGAACWALTLFAWGCAQVPPASRFSHTEEIIEQARKANAYQCAPRELAVAQGHLEFARAELELGDVARAGEHLAEAELNATAALRRVEDGCDRPLAVVGSQGDVSPLATTAADDDRDGDSIPDRVDMCPDQAEDMDGTVDRDGCPDPDNDGDGIEDARDNCPDSAEDMDGFEDGDGCPELDNDGDGVVDGSDACPLVRGDARTDGCPTDSYAGVLLARDGLELTHPITFKEGSSTLPASAAPTLDALARMLTDRPSLTLQIAAHTDSRGDDQSNLRLTLRQAEAVKAGLVERGVDAARLTVKGYGETRPLESNRTSLGRAANRRVEFIRTDLSPESAGRE